ncbi:uncharacterized protein [Miscanthus floridulus]|uniref:uncharacterized protein n=1 Tax=Miscanthus floridulus TaxID=154761 RepID=UPI003459F204
MASQSHTPQRSSSRSRSLRRRSQTHGGRRSRPVHPWEAVVERAVRETSSSGNRPQLTKTNYDSWSLLIKLKVQSRYLWDAIEDEDVNFHDDSSALEAICSGVPQEMVPTLATKPSTKEAWEAIRTMRIGDDRVRKLTAQSLQAEYEQIGFRDGEYVEDFALRLQLVISIETLLDINELSIEEVTGRLKAADDGHDLGGGSGSSTARLNHTEEELVARVVSRLQLSGVGASRGGWPLSSNQRRGHGHGAPKGQEGGGSSKSSPGGDGKKKKLAGDECAYCGKTRHWARECRKKKWTKQPMWPKPKKSPWREH